MTHDSRGRKWTKAISSGISIQFIYAFIVNTEYDSVYRVTVQVVEFFFFKYLTTYIMTFDVWAMYSIH